MWKTSSEPFDGLLQPGLGGDIPGSPLGKSSSCGELTASPAVPPGWAPESPSTASLEASEGLVDDQLTTCRALAQIVADTISSLSDAGQGLQRGTTSLIIDGILLETRLSKEEPPVARASHGLLTVCRGLSVTLIGLATALSGEVLAPLKEMHQRIESECAQQKQGLAQLREHEMACSNALTESLQKKDQVLAKLQGALRDQKYRPEKPKGKLSLLRSKPGAESAESKVQRAACSQTAAVEELAERTDEAMLARMAAHKGAQAFTETLARVDVDRRRALHTSITRFGAAWKEAARAMHRSAEQLRSNALELGLSLPSSWREPSLKSSSSTGSPLKSEVSESEVPKRRRSPSAGAARRAKFLSSLGTLTGEKTATPTGVKPVRRASICSDGQRGRYDPRANSSDEDHDSPFAAPMPGRSIIQSAVELNEPLSPSRRKDTRRATRRVSWDHPRTGSGASCASDSNPFTSADNHEVSMMMNHSKSEPDPVISRRLKSMHLSNGGSHAGPTAETGSRAALPVSRRQSSISSNQSDVDSAVPSTVLAQTHVRHVVDTARQLDLKLNRQLKGVIWRASTDLDNKAVAKDGSKMALNGKEVSGSLVAGPDSLTWLFIREGLYLPTHMHACRILWPIEVKSRETTECASNGSGYHSLDEDAQSTGCEDRGSRAAAAPVSDAEMMAELDRVKQASRAACLGEISSHLDMFLQRQPFGSYEEWIAKLHPESLKDKRLSWPIAIDHRYYLEDSDHRVLWNQQAGGLRSVPASDRSTKATDDLASFFPPGVDVTVPPLPRKRPLALSPVDVITNDHHDACS